MNPKVTRFVTSAVAASALALGSLALVAPAQAYTGTSNTEYPTSSSTWKYGIAQKYVGGKLKNDYIWSDMYDSKKTHRTGVGVEWTYKSFGNWKTKGYWAKHHNWAHDWLNRAYRQWP